MIRKTLLVVVLLLLVGVSDLAAREVEITPFWGYRFGGDFDDVLVPGVDDLEVHDGEAYGVMIDLWLHDNGALELLWSRQDTELRVANFIGPSVVLQMQVDNYHIGGLYLWGDSSMNTRPFVSFSMGITYFDPPSGFSSEDQYSFSLGAGARREFSDRFGMRVQARWTPTYINSTGGGVFCDPFACYAISDSHYLYQTEFSAGLTLRVGS